TVAAPRADNPLVTVIIPMRNEEAGIEACLDSVLANRLPNGGHWELLVLDGESEDRSPAIVDAIAGRDPRVRRLANPKRLQAPAFNLGLAAARGRYLVRMDAHSLYADDYLAECVRLLEETGAGSVGGVQRATGTSWLSRAVAAAVSSKFAAGDAAYRNATTPRWTDTVYLGAWRTETVRALGGMREDWAVNEDYEMNVRLRATGAKIYLSPTIRSTYFVRSSLAKLARQYVRYGFWKVRTLLAHPASLRWRQLVAPAFVLSLVLTPLSVRLMGPLGAAHLAVYLVANLAASAATASRAGWQYLPALPFIFFAVHCSWGSGFLAGCVVWPFRRHD
ncbi:MAG: glycosyltransferase family 2 protein, partial [Gemmatimonadales bacterium]|nr:glycosyltransferase family 2 protein [Gemmatimonadales bacterium]MBP9898666.1 glycosyltransferase family 2 protein [Gemmatimonadales bacterium]